MLSLLLGHDGINGSHGRDIDNVTHGAFEVGEVDRLVQPHLYRANQLAVRVHALQELVAGIGRGKCGEDERVHILAVQPREGVLLVAQLAVEGEVHLHLTVDGQVGIIRLHIFNGLVHIHGASHGVRTEVRITQHGNDRRLVEEAYGVGRQLGDINHRLGIGMAVDKGIGQEHDAFLRIEDILSKYYIALFLALIRNVSMPKFT